MKKGRIFPREGIIGVWVVVALMVLSFAGTGFAASLWTNQASMFADQKARDVGDLVTIIIVERSEASQTANTTTSKNGEVSIGPGMGVFQQLIPFIAVSGGDSMSAGGSTTRGGSLVAKMTTRVTEKLPGDVLRIEGRQVITINGEEQSITVSGYVRSRDIQPDNSVLSTFVADAEIVFHGSGALGDKQNPGLLTRIFNWLF